MSANTNNIVNNFLNSIRCCPFCAATGHLTFRGLSPVLYGVQCRSCGANIPANRAKSQDAIQAWNRRRGLASAGGKATKGIMTRKKHRSCRRNLRIARREKKMKSIRAEGEVLYWKLKELRAVERAEMQAERAENLAWLKQREPQIMADPALRQLYESLKKRDVPAAKEETWSHP